MSDHPAALLFICHSCLSQDLEQSVIRYDTRCHFNVRSKADTSQLNLPHGNDN